MMKQVEFGYDTGTQKGSWISNYNIGKAEKDNVFETMKKASREFAIGKTLAEYAYINRKQGVTREQLI